MASSQGRRLSVWSQDGPVSCYDQEPDAAWPVPGRVRRNGSADSACRGHQLWSTLTGSPDRYHAGLVDVRRCFADAGYRDEVAQLLARAQAQGQTVGCVSNSRDAQLLLGPHGPHTDPVWPGSAAEKREHALQCALGAIRLAERLGTPVVRLLVGCPDFARWLSWWGTDVSWADNIDEFFAHVEPVLRAAREAGLVVALEPHPKQIVYDRASAELLFAVGPQWNGTLALCVDPAN